MKYDVLKRAIKDRFVMLLINSKSCKINNKCDKDKEIAKKIKILYFIVKRDRREDVKIDFGFETISTHDNDFFDIVINVIDKKNDVIVVIIIKNIVNDKIDEINNAIEMWNSNIDVEDVNENKINEINVAFITIVTKNVLNFLLCFVRICSYNLILLLNFLKYCLQTNVFVFVFVIRIFSICCCCNRYAFLIVFFCFDLTL